MRSEIGKECRKLFRKVMAAEFSQYQEDKTQVLPQGWYVWTHRHPSGVWFHIMLVIHPTLDQFTTEVAWGFNGRLPGHKMVRDSMHEIFQEPLGQRSASFWSRTDHWWLLVLRPEEHERVILYKEDPVDECLPLIAPAVADAARKLKEHWVPAAEKIARLHGRLPGQGGGT